MVSPAVCPECDGRRLRSDSLAVRVGGRGIADYTNMPIEDAIKAFDQVKLDKRAEQIAGLILREIRSRLRFLETVGLGYLTLGSAVGDSVRRRRPANSSGDANWIATSRRACTCWTSLQSDCIRATISNCWILWPRCAIWATRFWLLSTMRKRFGAPTTSSILARARARTAELWWRAARQTMWLAIRNSVTGLYISGARKIPIPTRSPSAKRQSHYDSRRARTTT